LRLIGSDEYQWFRGAEAVRGTGGGRNDSLNPSFQVAESEIIRLEAFEDGPVGWAALEQKRTLVNGQEFVFRATMVLRLEASIWKIVQIHFSLPVPDESFLDVDLTETLSTLLASVDEQAGLHEQGITGLRTATVMFTDVVGSTSMSQAVGDEEWGTMITSHFAATSAIVESVNGAVVKTLGDGGMYLFPSASAGLTAAGHVQNDLASDEAASLRLRIGVHTGDVVQHDHDVLGLAVNKAARVAAAADGGQILVSSTTVDMVNTAEFTFGDPIAADLKGIDGTHILKPLLWNSRT
jgi:class 3 adenylate cyclase